MRVAKTVVAGVIGIGVVAGQLVGAAGADRRQAPRPVAAALAPTPPMGWNSWDSYGLRIDEGAFRANAEALATRLKPAGYVYAVIDEGWYMVNPEDRPRPETLQYAVDDYGRFIPGARAFPSALQGGRTLGSSQLAAWLHAQGLKFGLHVIRGIPRESVGAQPPDRRDDVHRQDAADQMDRARGIRPAGIRTTPPGRPGTTPSCGSTPAGARTS